MDKINTAKARKPLQEIPKTNFSNQPEDNNVERQGTYRDGVSQRREKAWPGEKKEMRRQQAFQRDREHECPGLYSIWT